MNFWGCSLGYKSALRFGVKGSAGHALHIHPLSSPHGIPTAHYSLTVQPADGGLRDVRYQWTRNGSRPDTTAVADYTNLHRTCDQDVISISRKLQEHMCQAGECIWAEVGWKGEGPSARKRSFVVSWCGVHATRCHMCSTARYAVLVQPLLCCRRCAFAGCGGRA